MGKYRRKFLLLKDYIQGPYGSNRAIPYGLECVITGYNGEWVNFRLCSTKFTRKKLKREIQGAKSLKDIIGYGNLNDFCPSTLENKRTVAEIRRHRKKSEGLIVSLNKFRIQKGNLYILEDKSWILSKAGLQMDMHSRN